MRSVIFFLASLAIITGCRSQKNSSSEISLAVDSVAASAHHRTMAVIDSAVSHLDFSFDTLKIKIERPAVGEAAEVVRLTAIKGRVVDRRALERNQVEVYNRLDTVRFKQSAIETSTQSAATTRLGSPPSATLLLALAIIVGALLLWLKYRR